METTDATTMLIRAQRVWTGVRGSKTRAIAIARDRIAALADEPHALDARIGPSTQVLDDPAWCVVPALYDTHNHLGEFIRNFALAPVERARTLAEFLELIAAEAARTPAGRWVQTSNAWHERNLVEQRAPTAEELDRVVPDRPVLCRRGGHVAFANTRALAIGGISREQSPTGMLEGNAVYQVMQHATRLPPDEQIENVGRATRAYAATGLGAIRDPIVRRDGMGLYEAAHRNGAIATRCRLMPLVQPTRDPAEAIAAIDGFAPWRDRGDDMLRVWGLKLVMDGGVEGAALEAPYANDPTSSGHLNWEVDVLAQVVSAALDRGWRVGVHCAGDGAVRTTLDAFERACSGRVAPAPGTLAIEHALLADGEQRARAIRLGVHVTVQHALLYALAAQMITYWGRERAARAVPVRDWLAEGAQLSAGTDYPVASFSPMESLWGFATRQTLRDGVLGGEQVIDRETALSLYTLGGATLDGETAHRGTLEPGKLADLVAFPADPLACPLEQLRTLAPLFTMVGGKLVYDARTARS